MLTGVEIQRAVETGKVQISPFNPEQINPNSYNLTLQDELAVYVPDWWLLGHQEDDTPKYIAGYHQFPPVILDCKKANPVFRFKIPDTGFVLQPGKLHLGATVEYTDVGEYEPTLDGRSSFARLGLFIHSTGGFGDVGFAGTWTLEISCVEPVRIYSGLQIAQLRLDVPIGDTSIRYQGKYQKQQRPTPSKIYKEL